MKTQFALFVLGCTLAACGTPWFGDDLYPGAAAPLERSDEGARVTYDCEGGVSFGAAFDADNGAVTITLQGQAPFKLYIAATGSGFAYMGEGRELRGKGDEAMWTDKEKPTIQCKARQT